MATLRACNGMATVPPAGSSYTAALELVASEDFVIEGRKRNLAELGDSVTAHIGGGVLPLTDIGAGVLSLPLFGHLDANGK